MTKPGIECILQESAWHANVSYPWSQLIICLHLNIGNVGLGGENVCLLLLLTFGQDNIDGTLLEL